LLIGWEKTFELVTLVKFLSKGHLKQFVLVQLTSLSVTQRVIFFFHSPSTKHENYLSNFFSVLHKGAV